ncbi:MAG: type III-B CRISPR module RAMP protein Cmr6 [Desulfobacterales bacterium]|nr:type III-B CRISPR module RAMP protein Cmr6 [Desulfobacterales bacterium]
MEKKHSEQEKFCKIFPKNDFEIITIKAKLKSNLITGIGESHPHEVSMLFEHNLGIPYIPASSIKGLVRFVHTIFQIPEAEKKGLIKNGCFDDEEDWTLVPELFGTQHKRGKVIFLDAYL